MLPLLDYFCLCSGQFDTLVRMSAHLARSYGFATLEGQGVSGACLMRLDLMMPNFAFSVALASFRKSGLPDLALLNHVAVADIIRGLARVGNGEAGPEALEGAEEQEGEEEVPSGAEAHTCLMRALLLFPLAVRPLLQEAGVASLHVAPPGSVSKESWADLLGRQPFSDAADYRHTRHGAAQSRLCGAYTKQCGALWRADLALRWLHSCAARLVRMHESTVFAEDLSTARTAWSCAPVCFEEAFAQDYVELQLPGEARATDHPPAFDRAFQARLHPPQPPAGRGLIFGEGGRPAPIMSIHSPPLLLFFQSLLPWAELDGSGLAVAPTGWRDLGRSAFGVLRAVVLFGLGLGADLCRLGGHMVQEIKAGRFLKGSAGV